VCNPDESPELRYVIYDLQSTNGIKVNNESRESFALRDGDRIQLGNIVCKFTIVDSIERNFLKEIKNLIEYDDRTKLLQIQPFYDRLEKSLEACAAKNSTVSVLMMDLDGLKQINDRHGHPMGTEVIVRIANLISEEMSPSGVVAMYGGDEFSAYLEDTTGAEAFERADRLRTLVSEMRFADKGIADRVTISIGIASYPGDGAEMMQIVANADRALFFAKAQGKNRVVVFDSDMAEVQD